MIQVLLAEDERIFRKGVVASLAMAPEIKVVGEVETGLDALNAIPRLSPDLVLMDLNMPVMGGTEATRRIKAAHPDVKVVILTVSDLDQDLFEAIKAGADGYLLKKIGPEELANAVRQAFQGDSPLSPAIAGKVLKEFRQGHASVGAPPAEPEVLTARELEVLQLATQGYAYKEIGTKLFVAESTVKNHMRHIMEKLQLRNRSEAVSYALRNRLTEN
ncbi:MAG TPA: response regulator transcription factor [Symbiobacteriaceae bacterium]|nr:response regulator transcription factor [Symbiobacteriaceae bacterium]